MSKLPEIRIKDAWIFRQEVSESLNKLWGDGIPLRSDDEYAQIVEKYQKAWKPLEQKILTAMTIILDLSFRQNIIDVYIAPWVNAFSDPMIIGVIFKPDEFVDTLTHELIHRLLTDNTMVPHELFLLPPWEKLFGEQHSNTALIHIPVHAVHKAIYLDVLQTPKRLERDIDNKKISAKDYLAGWEYVNQEGYEKIIASLKQSYKELAA